MIKIFLWICGITLGFLILFLLIFYIWILTWKTYKNDEFRFTVKVPKNWDIQDPRRDISDTQFVYDYGSILKMGDKETGFVEYDGVFQYQGDIIIYIYQHFPVSPAGLEIERIGSDGISKSFVYSNGKRSFDIIINAHDPNNLIKWIKLKMTEIGIIKNFKFY